jgi:hypothetical protein
MEMEPLAKRKVIMTPVLIFYVFLQCHQQLGSTCVFYTCYHMEVATGLLDWKVDPEVLSSSFFL